jgi:hypothetical protein
MLMTGAPSTTTAPHTSSLTEAAYTREYIGFAEFPIVTTSIKRPRHTTIECTEVIGTSQAGLPIVRTWQVVGSLEYGLPRLPDLDVFVGILKVLERYHYKSRIVPCTLGDICEIAGLARGGKTYQRIREAFLRFQTTSYIAKNHFLDPKTGERVLSEGWNIITDHRILFGAARREGGDGLPRSYFAVSDAFLNRLSEGQFKRLDLRFWRELGLGLEKPLFHYLDKNLYRKDKHEIGLIKLSQRIGTTGTYDIAQLKRLCARALARLVEKGFLRAFKFERAKSPLDRWKLVVYVGPRARGHVPVHSVDPAYQPTPEPSSPITRESDSAVPKLLPGLGPEPRVISEASVTDLVLYFRERFHGTTQGSIDERERMSARKLLERCGGDVQRAMSCIRWTRERAAWIDNFAGLLTNNYPDRALAELTAASAREAADVETKRLTQLRDRYDAWHRQLIDKRFQALPVEERDLLLSRALAELREGPEGEGFCKSPEQIQYRIAEKRVRGQLGRDLPSLEEWKPDVAVEESQIGTP